MVKQTKTDKPKVRRRRIGHGKSYISTVNHYLKGTYKGLGHGYRLYNRYQSLKKKFPWLPYTAIGKPSSGLIAPSGKYVSNTGNNNRMVTVANSHQPSFMSGGQPTYNVGNRARSILPPRLKTKLIYSEIFNFSTTSPNNFLNEFNANSLYAPNRTGGGGSHQPMGYDQLTPLYRSYVVTGVKFIVEGALSSSPAAQISIGAYSTSVTPPTTLSALNESSFYNTHVVQNTHRFKFEYYVDNAKVLGISMANYIDETDFWGAASSSPTVLTVCGLTANSLDLSACTCRMTVTAVYYCIFFNPLQLNQS